ncbi:flagellar FliL protein [Hoeflea marina]|uniref:Flagellar protein FliL n=1 Tax=Hoeflea marina TaxID=274592 RepID=A0A317PLB7_9HYPH|nr:flagellar basal body-associated FliL family protein [Hoeflea marina]PWV99806.1 flagellar FliL protein [Hoeflea marina]
MAETSQDEEGGGKKKSALIPTIAVVLVLTLIAGGGGWMMGGILAPQTVVPEDTAAAPAAAGHAAAEPAKGAHGEEEAGRPNVIQLEPITTNLSYPSENWIRIEVALLFRDSPDEAIADKIHQDILSYLRTVSLQQIEGPRGFQYLRDDLRERVVLRSEGRVTDLLFRTFVIE